MPSRPWRQIVCATLSSITSGSPPRCAAPATTQTPKRRRVAASGPVRVILDRETLAPSRLPLHAESDRSVAVGELTRRATSGLMQRSKQPSSCMDGPRLARDHLACSAEVACSHVSGLLVQSGWTAGPDGVREPRPHHSSGIDVPMNRQASRSDDRDVLVYTRWQDFGRRPATTRYRVAGKKNISVRNGNTAHTSRTV